MLIWTRNLVKAGLGTIMVCLAAVSSFAQATNLVPTATGLQTAQNPEDEWIFRPLPVSANPSTAMPFTGDLWLQENRQYLLQVTGNPGQYALTAQLRTVPSNDPVANAITNVLSTVNGQPVVINGLGYNLYATSESGEGSLLKGQTVWYAISALQDGTFTATVTPYSDSQIRLPQNYNYWTKPLNNPEMTIWQGTTLIADSKQINTNTTVNPYTFPNQISAFMLRGVQYYLRIDASDSPGEYMLSRSFNPKAPNDNIANAISLTSSLSSYDNGLRYLYAAQGANFSATTEPGEPLQLVQSVWFRLVTPIDGYLQAQVSTNSIYLFTLSSNQVVSVGNIADGGNPSFYRAGTTVYLAVSGSENIFNLSASLTAAPYNDYVTNGIALPGNAPSLTTEHIYNYFSKADETSDLLMPGVNNSLWWKCFPGQAGTLTVQDLDGNFGSDYWRLSSQAHVLDPLSALSGQKTYRISQLEDLIFKFSVADTNIGEGHLSFALNADPANDASTNAQPITSYAETDYDNGRVYFYSLSGIDNGYTQPGEPFPFAVWYQWAAPGDGYAQFSLSSSNVSYEMTDTGGSILANPTFCTPAENVLLAVGGVIDTYTIGVDFRNLPSNDEITNAIPLVTGKDFRFYTKYASMSQQDRTGAADLWCTYDPAANQQQVSFYVNPGVNGQDVTMVVEQDGAELAEQTFTQRNQPSLDVNFTSTNLVTLRIIVGQPNTDVTLLVTGQPNNDNFSDNQTLVLRPVSQSYSTLNGNIQLTKYTAHVVSNNRNATTEPNEPLTSFALHEPLPLAGKSLWWKVQTPVNGIFSLHTRPNSARLHFEVTTSPTLPSSINDFIAWNSLQSAMGGALASPIVELGAYAGSTYYIRVDTALADFGKLPDFDVSQIPFPAGDFAEFPATIQAANQQSMAYFKGVYPTQQSQYKFNFLGTIYGATRQEMAGTLMEKATESIMQRNQLDPPNYPAWQSIYCQFQPQKSMWLTLDTNFCNFSPVIGYTIGDPALPLTGYNYMAPGTAKYFQSGYTYTFIIDAAVDAAHTFTGNRSIYGADLLRVGTMIDTPVNISYQGYNSDFNRDCEDMIPGVVSFNLRSAYTVDNDSIDSPGLLTLQTGFLGNSLCDDPAGHYVVRVAENNSTATSETDPTYRQADQMGGAGKTVWWTITSPGFGNLTLDFSDSTVPVIVKVFPGKMTSTPGFLFNGPTATFAASASETYLIGVDSAPGTEGWIALTASEALQRPLNDQFANAVEITAPSTCGSLTGATIESGESPQGTGSIWYKIHNYEGQSLGYSFALSGNQQVMELYQTSGRSITNLLLDVASSSTMTYTAAAGETDYIRVFDTKTPPSGNITISLSTDPAWYQAQFYVTPSTNFVGSLQVWAYSLSETTPRIFYTTDGTSATTNSPAFSGPILLNGSAQMDFLVQFPGQNDYHVARLYIQLPDLQITPSRAFTNALLVTANAPADTQLLFARGDGNGNVPQGQAFIPFPTAGVMLTDSAWVNFQVVQAGNFTAQIARHYTNTVAVPQIVDLGTGNLQMSTPTPSAQLLVTQMGRSQSFPTNFAIVTAQAPTVTVQGLRSGWATSQNSISFTPTSTNLLALTIVTNTSSPQELKLTLVNPNPATYIWYTIQHNGTEIISSNAIASATLDLNYSCDLIAYAGNPQLTTVSPASTGHFVATLLPPTITTTNGSIIIRNVNSIISQMFIKDVPMGSIKAWEMNMIDGLNLYAYATSIWAEPSITNYFSPSYDTNIQVSPTSTTFSSNIVVTATVAAGSRLNVGTGQGGNLTWNLNQLPPQTRVFDATTMLVLQAQRNGEVYAQSTNIYTAKVGAITVVPPEMYQGGYSTYTPAMLECITPGVAYKVSFDNSAQWQTLSGNLLTIVEGIHTYRIQGTKAGWVTSDTVTVTFNGITPPNALINFVRPNYTILPSTPTNIPAVITATNASLVDNNGISYVHVVWSDQNPSPVSELYVFTPQTDFKVYHQVWKLQNNVVVETGPVLFDYVNVNFFDFRVMPGSGSTNDLDLVISDDPNVYNNAFFYKPTWIETWSPSVKLLAVSDRLAYNMDPLRRNGTQFLIPGNIYSTNDSITLRYQLPGETNLWHQFVMRFRTLMPSQYRPAAPSTNQQQNIIIFLSRDYNNQDVGAYYVCNTTSQNVQTNQPFVNPIALVNLRGTIPVSLTTTNDNYWFNSKYNVSGFTNMIPNFQGLYPVPIPH